jgi:hypothetical protein
MASESYSSVVARARLQLSNGFAEQVVLQNLVRNGLDPTTAQRAILEAKSKKGPVAVPSSSRTTASSFFSGLINGNTVAGVTLILVGGGLTLLSMMSAGRGGRFFLFPGMVIGGFWRLCVGLMGD